MALKGPLLLIVAVVAIAGVGLCLIDLEAGHSAGVDGCPLIVIAAVALLAAPVVSPEHPAPLLVRGVFPAALDPIAPPPKALLLLG